MILNKTPSQSFQASLDLEGFADCLIKNFKNKEIEKKLSEHKGFDYIFKKYGLETFSRKNFINDLEEHLQISFVKPQSLGAKRGKFFEDFIERIVIDSVGCEAQVKKQFFPEFMISENKDLNISKEKPDIVIFSDSFCAVINIQCDLWLGGQQSNRGEKYHDSNPDSLFGICKKNGYHFFTIVSEDPSTAKGPRARQIINKGRNLGILLWPADLINILRSNFHEKVRSLS